MTARNGSGGALTGATGSLTPDESEAPFVPGERREVSDPEDQGAVTAASGAAAPAQAGDVGEPGEDRPDEGPTELATRESGYGSERGLSPHDPAYRMESRPVPGTAEPLDATPSPERETAMGGDDAAEDEERF